ncbi:amino acid adenylation domain-containing protein [Streptomyces virginiae]|uniref:amino acid adenylation domain-containing protein n=1 Tax=Streptomyces virginiae TaxID=1961 RepID=UPI0036AD30E2
MSPNSPLSPDEIRPAVAADWYALSSGQLAMWMVAQSGVQGAYAVPGAYELTGELDSGVLRCAFEDLLSRHESLRTGFGVVDGVPMQRVVEDYALDWSAERADCEAQMQQQIREFVARDFDLAEGKLLHVLLIERSADLHVLVVSAHHIAVDGWSLTVLIDQVATSYRACLRGEPLSMPASRIQYKDYASWQQGLLQEGFFEEAGRYWQRKFDGGVEPLDLPTDRPRPVVRTYQGEVVTRVLGMDALNALKAVCHDEQATLFAGLSAVLRVQLHRYTGQRDFVLGTSALARPVPELYDQIGYYINSLALRDTVEPGTSFRSLLRTVQTTLLDGLRHHEYPFDRVVRDAGAVTDHNRNALFDIMVMVDQGWGDPTESVEGLRVRHFDVSNDHSKMDLTLYFKETPTGLQATAEYSTELFDKERIERLLGHFETLLRATSQQPDQPVDTLHPESIPTNQNGKVDPRALTALSRAQSTTTKHRAPRTELEQHLAEIWQSLLPASRLGVTDDFFAVGGHSLLALQLSSRIGQQFGIPMPVAAVFKHRTIAEQAQLIAESQAEPGTRRPELTALPRSDWYALSSGQLAMWMVAQSGVQGAYAVPGAYELTGELDSGVLRCAFEDLLSRHESLRTGFGVVDGVPMQRVVEDYALDWSAERADCEAQMQQQIREFVARDFDLAEGKLLHVLLIERSADLHVLVVSAHHIAVDGWSLTVLIDQVATSYRACLRGEPLSMPASRIQYKDYASWQQGLLQEGFFEEAGRYWQRKFDGGVEPLDLPTDRPRPVVRTYQGEVVTRVLGLDALNALKAVCHDEQATLFAGLSAVLRVQLHRYTGQRDFVLGTSALARPVPELYDQIGYYINSLALRDTVEPGTSFRSLLRTVQTTLLDGLRHHEYPFDRVVRDAGAVTDHNRNALFDIMVMVDQGWGDPTESVEGLRVRHFDVSNDHSKMDLTLYFKETPTGLQATAEYSTELFDKERIERLLGHFETLLRATSQQPDQPVDTLPMLTTSERQRVLVEFNRTDTDYELGTPVPQLFEQQVLRSPHNIATTDDHQALTYTQLNARANAIAWTLREEHGVGAGTLVALYLGRSVDLTAAILGVLKAGGAYLPISTQDPVDRIEAVLHDSGSSVVIVQDAHAVSLLGRGRPVLDITAEESLSRREDNPPPLAGPDDLAYCIYTSGSTGRPKGVLIEHRAIVNRLRWMVDDLGLDGTDVILQKTPYAFDVSVWELLLPGLIGAKQVMLRPEAESDPTAIRDAIDRHGVTTVHFVPSMLSQYLASLDNGMRNVRNCVCSGEELSDSLAQKFFATTQGGQTRLFNYYGPTEAAVDVTTLQVKNGPMAVTIGRPAPNNRIYLLGDDGQPCPIGVTGEICIGGSQVARGYLNRPELTAERFTADPFHPGQRIYHTGDLARWLDNGEILYLGRRDGQLKVRGFRIELGEIEQALCDQPGVERAVVMLQRDQSGVDYLCAYVEGPDSPPADRLRGGLTRQLPRYMVPSHYVHAGSIPTTQNGKVDRRALAAMSGAQSATTEYRAPRTELEQHLAEIWQSLLPASRLGVTDDFFVIGGHSLLALQLSSRIGQQFGIPIQGAAVFKHRTIAEQAQLITESQAEPGTRRPKLTALPRSERHVLSFAQERMWFLHMLDPDSAAYNIRALAKFDGLLDPQAFEQAVRSLVERHETLRVLYVNSGEQTFQAPQTDLPVPFELRDLTGLGVEAAREYVQRAVREDDTKPFRLQEEAPLRVVLFRISNTEHQLLTTLHHIAGDGWSLQLMLRELGVLYTQHLGDAAEGLPDLPVQYIDYAEAMRQDDYRDAIDSDVRYWLARLAHTPSLELPTDVVSTGVDCKASGRAGVTVSADASGKLRELAGKTASTTFEITMAALALLLSRLGDQQDLVVGYPVANRQSVELEGIVGLFLNTLALRTDLSGNPTFTELMGRVTTGIHEAYEHQAAPFELLVERLNPVRHLDRSPIFNVLLNYVGTLREEISIRDVSVEFDDQLFEPEAKFPLSFYVLDEGEGMRIELVYRADLFSPARAQSMLHQFRFLLEQVTEAPDEAIASYSLVLPGTAEADLTQPLAEPEHAPVTELIAERAATAPDRVAVTQGSRAISYGELLHRSEAVARRLVTLGCETGQVVGVTGPRGIGFVVAMLGVLRSGATFFPLDPALPEGRRRQLLTVGKPTLFVRAEDSEGDADGSITAGLPAVRVDARTGLLSSEPAQAALPPVSSRSSAYLFFTSGTTGTPRGVLGWHGALSHFLSWQSETFGISVEDRCAQLTSASFDVMLRDTLLVLISGGTLVVPEASDMLGGKAVLGWLERERITVLHAAPTVLQSWLLDAPPESRLPNLRWTFLAGEPLKASLVDSFRTRYPSKIVNLYGPTETTMAKFAYQIPFGPLPPVLPVGSPLPQCQVIVTRDRVACGVGESGEIIIRTPFRTLGYLDDPEANEAAFFPNPHRADKRDLLYRTGDIGRLRPDGLVEIVGRADHQIKVSGVRIHPAEIENTLGQHHLVSACLVIAHKNSQDEYRLVAYVVADTTDATLGGRLRQYLTDHLPHAMVPAEFVLLDRIPTNSNGKPDHAALPEPRFSAAAQLAAAEAPRTVVEHRILEAWTAALACPVPGVNQNFFELGGTSLKVLRLYALLEENFPQTFRVAQLFTHPTIALQARLVEPMLSHSEDEVFEYDF